jgi:hypothetical protein
MRILVLEGDLARHKQLVANPLDDANKHKPEGGLIRPGVGSLGAKAAVGPRIFG